MVAQPNHQSGNLHELEAALGHTFRRPDLLIQALTHRSQAYEAAMETAGKSGEATRTDNERLEFLGDAILGLVVAETLYTRYSDWQEGELTRLRAQFVSRLHLASVAQTIGLGKHLLLGHGEDRSGGRKKTAILANAMEAVIAAMYLDAGHLNETDHDSPRGRELPFNPRAADALEPVRAFAHRHILGLAADDAARELRSGASLGDHKSAMQEFAQAGNAGVPTYIVEGESGPDHRKRFRVALHMKDADGHLGAALARGNGTTKKRAEQEAARRALALLRNQQPSSESAEELRV